VRVRLAKSADAEAIRAIYNAEVTGTTFVFDIRPRTATEQIQWLDDHAGAHPAIVAVDGNGGANDIVGFGSLSPYRSRPAYATTVEDSVYVHTGHRGRGVGKLLLGELVRLGTAHGFHAMIGRIVDRNEPSIKLHESCGFQLVGVEREVGRKFGRWLDVAVMQRML
jgi:phosphinothricin acetyltransferase